MHVRNVHQRLLPGPPERVGALIDSLATPDDRLWPIDHWPPIRFDRPLAPGAEGGHGPIRYQVESYDPGRRIAFRFTRMPGLHGGHHLVAEPDDTGSVLLRHVAEGRLTGRMLLVWPLVIRPLHNALIEDLLDRAELAVTGTLPRPARWSPWVRLLRARLRRPGLTARASAAASPPAPGTGTGTPSPAAAPDAPAS
jgi:hypothetical protein